MPMGRRSASRQLMNEHEAQPNAAPFSGGKVVLACFLAQNVAMGFALGSFGPLLASTQQHFGVTRAVATTGMSLMMLAVGGLSPFIGGLLQRVSVSKAMVGGALLSAVGYWGLALLSSFNLALIMFSLIGVGVCVMGILGPLTLINRWFATDRAKVLSVVNLPIALFVTPYLVAALLPNYGRLAILGGIGAVFLLLILPLALIVDDPARIGQAPHGAGWNSGSAIGMDGPRSMRQILMSAPFWLLSLAMGATAGAAIAFVVHIVPFGIEQHMSLQTASGLLSLYSAAGIGGTLLFGWIADRIGPPSALVLTTFFQALLWWGLLHVTGPLLFMIAALLGVCVVPITTLHGAALSQLVGPASISRAMGISYAIKLPFIFTFAPFVGHLFDLSGGYRLPFLFTTGILAVSCLFFVLMTFAMRESNTLSTRREDIKPDSLDEPGSNLLASRTPSRSAESK
jgi:cyanate permease